MTALIACVHCGSDVVAPSPREWIEHEQDGTHSVHQIPVPAVRPACMSTEFSTEPGGHAAHECRYPSSHSGWHYCRLCGRKWTGRVSADSGTGGDRG